MAQEPAFVALHEPYQVDLPRALRLRGLQRLAADDPRGKNDLANAFRLGRDRPAAARDRHAERGARGRRHALASSTTKKLEDLRPSTFPTPARARATLCRADQVPTVRPARGHRRNHAMSAAPSLWPGGGLSRRSAVRSPPFPPKWERYVPARRLSQHAAFCAPSGVLIHLCVSGVEAFPVMGTHVVT